MIDTDTLKVGDPVVIVMDGEEIDMTVSFIEPAGSAARAERHGPMVSAHIRPGGYGVSFDRGTTAFDVRAKDPS